MFQNFKNTTLKKLLSTVALVCFLLVVLVFFCWMNLISYITSGNLIKTKIYIFIYVLWNTNLLILLGHFFYVAIKWIMFFSVSLLFFLKPKLFYQHLFESLRKQKLRGILLNIHVFNLINFKKLLILFAIFVNTQETFQHCLNVVVRLIWRRDVGESQIKVETNLRSNFKFTTLNNAKSTLSISTLILTTLDNFKMLLLFSTSSFTTLVNVETTLWIWSFSKGWKKQKTIFELQKKMTHLINNTCFWLWSIKNKGKHVRYNVKIDVGNTIHGTWKEYENNSMSLLIVK